VFEFADRSWRKTFLLKFIPHQYHSALHTLTSHMSHPTSTKAILLASYPQGKPTLDNFKTVELPLPAELQAGEVPAHMLPCEESLWRGGDER